MKIGTFNIRVSTPKDLFYGHAWVTRMKRCYNIINQFDIVGLQEVSRLRVVFLFFMFIWKYKIIWGGFGIIYPRNPILVKRRRFGVLDHDWYYLNDKTNNWRIPDRDSIAEPRTINYAHIIDRTTGEFIDFYNTHLDHKASLRDRIWYFDLIHSIITDVNNYKHQNPLIFTGDFNFRQDEDAYNHFVRYFDDLGVEPFIYDNQNIRKGWYSEGPVKAPIDFIFTLQVKPYDIKEYGTIEDDKASDHYARYKVCE